MKRKLSLSVLTILNIIFISYLVMKYNDRIDLVHALQELRKIPHSLIITTIALNLSLMFLYGCRLSNIINERMQVGFGIAAVGYAANNLLPLRLGELTRIYFAQKKYQVPASRSVLAMLSERVSDLFSIGCLGLIAVFSAASDLPVSETLIIIGLLSPFMLFVVINLYQRTRFKIKLQQHKIYVKYIQPLYFELQKLLTLKKLLTLIVYTLLIWVVTTSVFFIFFQNSLPQIHFSLLDAICLTVCTSLSLAISTLPSSIGIFEAGIIYYLHSIKNVDETTALTLALTLHVLILAPQILCMCYFLLSKYKITTQPIEITNLLEQP